MEYSVGNCELVDIPKVHDRRGNLSFLESTQAGFDIKRIYYLYDIPADSVRGGHAHKKLKQVIIALSGSFDVVLDDGVVKRNITLARPYQGLYMCPMIWRELVNFSSGEVGLVLASDLYDESDYYRDYQEYLHAVRQKD